MLRLVLVVVLVALAGCQVPSLADEGTAGTGTPDTGPLEGTSPEEVRTPRPDPDTDRLGWEMGYWHDDPLAVTAEDGLNESELSAVVGRAMARVEDVRGLEFESNVSVTVIDRAEYANRSDRNHSATFRRFDNAKFEALFLVGNDEDALATQESTRAQNVLGYYSPERDAIVIVSDSETPKLDGELTLGHELVHALQDQRFGLNESRETRDGVQGYHGLVEGDAKDVEWGYRARCGQDWECLARASRDGASGSSDIHVGIQYLEYFPYDDGVQFVDHLQADGGMAAVDDAYADPPDGAAEVIYPETYPDWTPATVTLSDRSSAAWERVRPDGRPDYAVLGQSAIAAGLVYPIYVDYDRDARPVAASTVINTDGNGNTLSEDPLNYDVRGTEGWAGGRLHVYSNGADTGYVWRTRWESSGAAALFVSQWEQLVTHWGGTQSGGDYWTISEGPFEDAFRVSQDGRTVTIVNGPTQADLDRIHEAPQ